MCIRYNPYTYISTIRIDVLRIYYARCKIHFKSSSNLAPLPRLSVPECFHALIRCREINTITIDIKNNI